MISAAFVFPHLICQARHLHIRALEAHQLGLTVVCDPSTAGLDVLRVVS